MVVDIEKMIIKEEETILGAMEYLDQAATKVLFVAEGGKLLAALTDGDIRRWILQKGDLNAAVKNAANYSPKYLVGAGRQQALQYMREQCIDALPIVDDAGMIHSIVLWNENEIVLRGDSVDVPVVIMAGGLGTRLYPYTKILPKPLIPVADIPITERIIHSFQHIGCQNFYMIVNHKKNMIKAYFNDLDTQYSLKFCDEDTPLGTGGGISLLRDMVSETFVLTNCDVLILEDVRKIIKHHRQQGNKVTMVCSLKNYVIPYGVVNFTEGGEISSFEEKPSLSFFTNTGYYILEPDVYRYVADGEKIGMPDILLRMKEDDQKIGVYPIGENAWMDMGQFDTMESMERRLRELGI